MVRKIIGTNYRVTKHQVDLVKCDITPSDLSTKCYWLQTETSTICMITDYMGLYGLLEFQGPYGLRLQKCWLRSHLW